MADDTTMTPERVTPPALRGERALPPGRGAAEPTARGPAAAPPRTPEEAREELARTRARMSATLDRIEHRLVAKKIELRQRLSLRDRLAGTFDEHPLPFVAAAFVAGFWIGGKL